MATPNSELPDKAAMSEHIRRLVFDLDLALKRMFFLYVSRDSSEGDEDPDIDQLIALNKAVQAYRKA